MSPETPRRQAIAMAVSGMTPKMIAAQTGQSAQTVARWLSEGRRAGHDVPTFAVRHVGIVVLSTDQPTRARLQAEADRRGLTELQLIDLILGVVAADDLFNAVLEGAY